MLLVDPLPRLSIRVRMLAARGLSTAQTLRGLITIGLFVCGALLVMQDDSWWHLRCGQMIWEARGVPKTDPFSFVLPGGTYWPNHEWLAQVLMYAAFWIGGLPLLSLGGAVVVAAAGRWLLDAMSGPAARRFVLLLFALPWIVAGLSARPQIFTLLGVSITLWLLVHERWRYLPLVFLLWANLHGAVSIGGMMLVGACLAALVFDRKRAAGLVLTTIACGAATLLTPMGFRLLTFPLESVHRLRQLGLTEWTAPGFSQWQHLYFWASLLALAVLVALRWRRITDWESRLLAVVAGLLAMLAVISARNVPLFEIGAAVCASRILARSRVAEELARSADLPRRADRPILRGVDERDHQPRNLGVLVVFAAVAIAAVGVAYSIPLRRLDWHPVSPAALGALRACPQPMFNTYNTGGFLLWFAPERKVFVDSRQDPYALEFLLEVVRVQRTGDHRELFERYGIRAAAMEPGWPLGKRLLADGWRKLHEDEQWLILTRGDDGP